MSTGLREAVREHLSPPRIERQWAALAQAGLPGPARRGARSVGLVTALLFGVGAAVASMWFMRVPVAPPTGALVESAQAEVGVRLEDGSRAFLDPQSRIGLLHNQPRNIDIELRAGSVRFDVTHHSARTFKVKAGPAEVSVIGTRFSIARTQRGTGLLVRVAVSEGVVEVRRSDVAQGEVRRIRAGESWSALIPDRIHNQVVVVPDVKGAAPVLDAPSKLEAAEPQPRRAQVAAPQHVPPAPEPLVERTPSELFRLASLARRAGSMREAASTYAELVAQYPSDARAGLCAFELGRIRMDALSDEKGAIDALERSLKMSASASYREDAIARIVIANDALGFTAACLDARQRYLATYPNGVHARALLARCR